MPNFLHRNVDFQNLLDEVAARSPLRAAAMVEKDYWIVHTLWALQQSGLQFNFKGGTSLSKAYQITDRFSEDIDLVVVEATWDTPRGRVGADKLPTVDDDKWHSSGKVATAQRRAFWTEIVLRLDIPDVELTINDAVDPSFRNVKVEARYPGHHVATLKSAGGPLREFVLVELTYDAKNRRVDLPSVPRPITSYVHEFVGGTGAFATGGFDDTRVGQVQCVHPMLTLLEKLDAITKRYAKLGATHDAAGFVRHYGDVACIIRDREKLPPLAGGLGALHAQMLAKEQIKKGVSSDDPAFRLPDPTLAALVRKSHAALAPMFWAEQLSLDDAIATIRTWLDSDPTELGARTTQ